MLITVILVTQVNSQFLLNWYEVALLLVMYYAINCDTDLKFVFNCRPETVQRFSRAGPRGRAREWATQGVHPLSWLLNNNRLEEVCGTLTKGTFSSRLLLSNQDKGCTPSVAHFLPLPPSFCSTCLVCLLIRRRELQKEEKLLTTLQLYRD